MPTTEELLQGCLLTEESILRDLQDLSLYYEDMNVASRVAPTMEIAPLPTLVAMMDVDEQDRSRVFIHSFLPLDMEDAEFTKYLQFYAELQNSLEGVSRVDLLEALCRLNSIIPFGCCLLIEPRPELNRPLLVALKGHQGFPLKQTINQGVFTEDAFLFDTSCELVSQVLDRLVQGQDIETALHGLG